MSLLSFDDMQTLSRELKPRLKLGTKAFMNEFPKLIIRILKMTLGSILIFVQIFLALVQSGLSGDQES